MPSQALQLLDAQGSRVCVYEYAYAYAHAYVMCVRMRMRMCMRACASMSGSAVDGVNTCADIHTPR